MAPFKNGHTTLLCRARFLSLGTIDIFELDNYLLWGCPVHRRIFNSIPGLYLPEASKYPISVTTKNVSTLPDVA